VTAGEGDFLFFWSTEVSLKLNWIFLCFTASMGNGVLTSRISLSENRLEEMLIIGLGLFA
jgi:hypothetical protein